VLFVSEKAVTRTSNNAYSLNPVKEVRHECYYFPPSVHLVTFYKIGARDPSGTRLALIQIHSAHILPVEVADQMLVFLLPRTCYID
jgi:hypothetical protein